MRFGAHRVDCACSACKLPMLPLWRPPEEVAIKAAPVRGLVVAINGHGTACLCEECVDAQVVGGGAE